MAYEPAVDRASIVMVGQFNPAIFHPSWLARHALIRDEEASNVQKLIVTDQVTEFTVDWLTLHSTTDRFMVYTDQSEYSMALRDLVLGAFSLLEHTPFWAVGMNREMHFAVETEGQWHQYGHVLAPKELWAGLIDNPGMRSLVMWGQRPDASDASIQYKVEPSLRLRPYGLFFACNEHRGTRPRKLGEPAPDNADDKPESTPESRRTLMEAVGKGWESAQKYARSVAEAIMERGRDAGRR